MGLETGRKQDMESIRSSRDVIDANALGGFLAEFAAGRAAASPACRRDILAYIKDAMESGRAELRRRFDAGAAGPKIAAATAALVDRILERLFDFASRRVFRTPSPSGAERLALVAVGGYGRGEMAPYSDVDLMFLHPHRQTAWGERVAEYLLYLLWDMGLEVGHASRSIDDAIRLAQRDMSIRTALLEARLIAGEATLYHELRQRFASEVVAGSAPEFVQAKLAERKARHHRLGDSRYLVEPNVKEGKGGLRDLHTLFWIAKYLYGTERTADLVGHDVLTPSELRRFVKAESFLWTVRCRLHDLAGRAEERLTFDAQPEIGRRLHYTDHAGSRGVERFMKHYHLVAKDVGDLTRIFCAALEEQHKRKPLLRLPKLELRRAGVAGFRIDGGRLDVTRDDVFAGDPVNLLRLFHLADRRGLDIHPHALRLIPPNLKHIDARLRADAEANRLFLEVLTSQNDPETALRRMNEAGVFGRFVPDFGRIVAQMQYDMYHVYTVDEHSIRAIGILSQIARGELAEEHPLASELIHKLRSRRVLYLALLLHDIAKGRAGDHSALGAAIARKLAHRLGLGGEEAETVTWLVRHHLVMSHVAFKRDLQDPKTVADFAELVQSRDRLRLMLVLTVADIRAVGPGRWNGWKGQLLRELYSRSEAALIGGHGVAGQAERVGAAQAALHARLAGWSDQACAAHFARLGNPYWLSVEAASLERHARLIRKADAAPQPLAIDVRIDRFRAASELTVYTADEPGLFARIAGAMAISGANVVDARVFTTADGMALDTFWVQDADRHAFAEPRRLATLRATIGRSLRGAIKLDRALARRAGAPERTRLFTVEPRVLIDNDASDSHTVIEVNGRDRTGLLYDVTLALAGLGLGIANAHITTFGERAVDVFYVSDRSGRKITQPRRLETLRKRLLGALGGAGAPPRSVVSSPADSTPSRRVKGGPARTKAAPRKAKAAGRAKATAKSAAPAMARAAAARPGVRQRSKKPAPRRKQGAAEAG